MKNKALWVFLPLLLLLIAAGSGNIYRGTFIGDGSQLTGVANTNALTPTQQAILNSAVTNTQVGVTLSGTFSGTGSGLGSLNASQITSGTLNASQLPSSVLQTNTSSFPLMTSNVVTTITAGTSMTVSATTNNGGINYTVNSTASGGGTPNAATTNSSNQQLWSNTNVYAGPTLFTNNVSGSNQVAATGYNLGTNGTGNFSGAVSASTFNGSAAGMSNFPTSFTTNGTESYIGPFGQMIYTNLSTDANRVLWTNGQATVNGALEATNMIAGAGSTNVLGTDQNGNQVAIPWSGLPSGGGGSGGGITFNMAAGSVANASMGAGGGIYLMARPSATSLSGSHTSVTHSTIWPTSGGNGPLLCDSSGPNGTTITNVMLTINDINDGTPIVAGTNYWMWVYTNNSPSSGTFTISGFAMEYQGNGVLYETNSGTQKLVIPKNIWYCFVFSNNVATTVGTDLFWDYSKSGF